MHSNLFPFAEYWWLYLGFTALVVLLLGIDLLFHRKERVISFREAGLWTAVWVALGLAFSYALYLFAAAKFTPDVARRLSFEYLAGYIMEESLSVDNMFVFALVFRYFGIPGRLQHRVLFYGVLGAMVFRALFITVGAALIAFHWVMVLFGVFLIFTGIRLALESDHQMDPGRNPMIRWVRRWFPVTPDLHGHSFFVRLKGVTHVTPLLVVLLVLETTDIVFAVDSVPAVFGVTREPLIVFTSNVFAILGLRSMYFLLAGAIGRFHALQYGLSVVLVFVGLKMAWLDGLFGGRFPIGISLAVIAGVIGASIALSLIFPKGLPDRRTLARWAVGALCLGLATLSVLAAMGPARNWGLLVHVAEVEAEWFWISAACYLAGGLLLMRRAA